MRQEYNRESWDLPRCRKSVYIQDYEGGAVDSNIKDACTDRMVG